MENLPIPVFRTASLSNAGNVLSPAASLLATSQVTLDAYIILFLSIRCRKKLNKSTEQYIHSLLPQQEQQQPPHFSVGGASRLLCRKLARSLHLSLDLAPPRLTAATKIPSSRKLRGVFRRTVPREECLTGR